MSTLKQFYSMSELKSIALVLENEGTFYNAYDSKSTRMPTSARDVVRDGITMRYLLIGVPKPPSDWEEWAADVEILRRYFDRRYDINRPKDSSATAQAITNAVLPELYDTPQPKPVDTDQPHVTFDTKEPTMNKTAIIEITTKTLVNGQDVATMSDASIYDLIAAQEAEIERLSAIKAKPKKLMAEIEKRQAGIAALVAHLDSK